MRTYSYVKMIVDGKETAKLDIYAEHNVFQIFDNSGNVFSGSHHGAMEYIESWKMRLNDIRTYLETAGKFVSFEQTIK